MAVWCDDVISREQNIHICSAMGLACRCVGVYMYIAETGRGRYLNQKNCG